MSSDEHPEWCHGAHDGHMHESPRNEIEARGVRMTAQVNDYGTTPFLSASAYRDAAHGGTLIVHDLEAMPDVAGFLDAIAGAGAPAIHRLAGQVRDRAALVCGPEAEAEA